MNAGFLAINGESSISQLSIADPPSRPPIDHHNAMETSYANSPHSQQHNGTASAAQAPTMPLSGRTTPTTLSTGMAAQKGLPPHHANSDLDSNIEEESNPDVNTDMDMQTASTGSPSALSDVNSQSNGDVGGSKSAGGDSKTPKKKTQQKFHCTDFPPCQLSFTRSEHLARHIR
jgi:hypothetical protein